MFKNRLKGRLSVLALGTLLLGSLSAPVATLAAEESTCGQLLSSPCGCCLCLCRCGCGLADGSTGCTDQTDEADEPTEDTEGQTDETDETDETADPTNETETGDDTDETGDETDVTVDPNAELRLNELLPNPVGTDTEGEFIEIVNRGAAEAPTNGWLLRDTRGRTFELPEVMASPDSPLAFPYSQTKLTLVNSGGTLELVGPDGMVRDSVTYGESDEGWSYTRDDAAWSWTHEPTPNLTNAISSGEEETTDETEEDDSPTDETDETDGETPADDKTVGDETDDGETVPANVRLSELLPNPAGDDLTGEWIELHNPGETAVDLTGWWLDDIDGGSSPFELDGQTVPAHGYLLLNRPTTGLSLNNGGDTVRLLYPDGETADSFEYADSEEGQSYARDDEGWFATDDPTPDEANTRPTPSEDAPEEPTEEDETAEETIILSVEQAHNVADETRVTIRGVVTVQFGVLGQTIFGLRDTDSDYGATVRVYASDRPELHVGDLVDVDGTIRRRDSGELRLDTFGPQPVRVTGNLDRVDAPDVLLGEIDGSAAGLTVTVNGLVTDSGDGWVMLSDEPAEHELKIELPGSAAGDLTVGSRVSVRGIVRIQRSMIALAVLDDSDLVPEEPTEGEETDGETLAMENEDDSGAGDFLPFVAVGALGAGGAAYRGFKKDRRENKRRS